MMQKVLHIIKQYALLFIVLFVVLFMVFVQLPHVRATVVSQLYQILCEPVVHFTRESTQGIYTLYERLFMLRALQDENRRLKKRLAHLEGQEVELLTLAQEVTRLRGILGLQPKLPFKLKVAEVIALEHSTDRKALWINAGHEDGVLDALPVIDHRGVVGQVMTAGPRRSMVLALQDPLFRAHVVNLRTHERALVTGESQGSLLLLRYAHRHADVKIGDTYITSGLGNVFPHGIGVGKVADISQSTDGIEKKVWITPFVDAQKTQEVFVVLSKQRTIK